MIVGTSRFLFRLGRYGKNFSQRTSAERSLQGCVAAKEGIRHSSNMASVVGKVKELRKSRSITDSSSSADLPVGRNITEQLRYNHIETLEQLQLVSDENVKLKNELKKLKEEMHNPDDAAPEASSDETTAVKVTLIDMIEKEKEIKLLKAKLAKIEMEMITVNNTNNRLQASIAATNSVNKSEKNKQTEIIIEPCKICSNKANIEDEKIKILESTLLIKINEMDELRSKNNDLLGIDVKNRQCINDLESQVNNLTIVNQDLSSNNLQLQQQVCKLSEEMADMLVKYNIALQDGQEILGKLGISDQEHQLVKEKYLILSGKYKKLLEALESIEHSNKDDGVEVEEGDGNPSFFYTSTLNLSNYNYNHNIGKTKSIVTLVGGDESANLSLTFKREVH